MLLMYCYHSISFQLRRFFRRGRGRLRSISFIISFSCLWGRCPSLPGPFSSQPSWRRVSSLHSFSERLLWLQEQLALRCLQLLVLAALAQLSFSAVPER